MTFEEALVDLLQGDAAVLAAVGERVWPVAVRVNPVWPAITYGRESGERLYALDSSPVRQVVVMVVRCWAQGYPAARLLADAAAGALALQEAAGVAVATVRDGADVWLDGHDVFGCTLVVEMEALG